MKNYLIAALSIFAVVLLLMNTCNKPQAQINDTSKYENAIDSLVVVNNKIKYNNEKLEIKLDEAKRKKDKVVYVTKNHYIMAYDTLTNDSVECLPKPYVDSLAESFEYVLAASDSLIVGKDIEIDNLEKQNNIKDTIIVQLKNNEEVLQKSLKKEKKKKWRWGIGGLGLGYLFGKSF